MTLLATVIAIPLQGHDLLAQMVRDGLPDHAIIRIQAWVVKSSAKSDDARALRHHAVGVQMHERTRCRLCVPEMAVVPCRYRQGSKTY